MGFVRALTYRAASGRHRRLAAFAAALCLVVAGAAPAEADAPPSSMAALGDSITRGYNACGWFVDCTSRSFSTGTNGTVNSQYLRILARNPAISGRAYNDARSGATSSALAGQAATAVSQQVEYVTVLIGANDACTASEAGMTSVATYRSRIDSALRTIQTSLPNAKVALISVPDVYRLWQVGRTDVRALAAWSAYGICQSMLYRAWSPSATDNARRLRVRQRVIDYNTVLAAECAEYGPKCDFDDHAVFGYRFTLSQLSAWDFFHPSTSGQAELARVTYAAVSW
jgi:lysophospholipase L1-like esterase